MKLLHLDASILGSGSVSRKLSAAIVERLRGRNPSAEITYRDLARDELAHVNLVNIASAHPAAAAAGPLDADGLTQRALTDAVVHEFLAADTLVIGAPMYNFTIPSHLKAWIDRIVIPGVTYRYGPTGPEGLATGKRVIVAVARGGFYGADTPAAAVEHGQSYLQAVFGFLGATTEFIVAEGVGRGDDNRAKGLAAANEAIERLAA
jgi:FMN-dependent NADH-azoreductase